MHWKKVAVMGLGLLGGSLGLALRERRVARVVAGYVRRPGAVGEATRMGVADLVSGDVGAVVKEAEVVVLATPITEMAGLARQMAPNLHPGALVMDVGSVKRSVVAEVAPIVAQAGGIFVGAHPMAGGEKTGVSNARSNLFERAICVLTPTPETPDAVVIKAAAFWQAVGGSVLKLRDDVHDALVARASHLPHLIAAQLANYILDPASPKEQRMLCASGFRDSTRIASGSPQMWREIVLANRENLAEALDEFLAGLQDLLGAVRRGDPEQLGVFLEKAKQRRDQWRGETPLEG